METTFFLFFTFLLLQRFGTSSSDTAMRSSSNVTCIERERRSLLMFKHGIIDKENRLSTWAGLECCEWQGVECDMRNGHVVKLDLRTPVSFTGYPFFTNNFFGGELSRSLLNLNHLRYLDLSVNSFSGQIPEFLGSFKRLEYLNLSCSGFGGVVPYHLGNLSRLQYLDLNNNLVLESEGSPPYRIFRSSFVMNDLMWVSSLASLKHLDLSSIEIGHLGNWFQSINMLPSLLTLNLASCDIDISSIKSVNFSSLNSLDLSNNNIDSTVPVWLSNLTGLMHLHLKGNSFHGQIPDVLGTLSTLASIDLSENSFDTSMPNVFGNMSSLVRLDLRGNMFHGLFPPYVKLCNLSVLNLSGNKFSGDLSSFMGNMSDCLLNSLKDLNLGSNKFNGSIPNKLGYFKKLEHLLLYQNTLSGPMPSSLGGMSSLRELDISFNQISGIIPASLGQLSMLEKLDFSFNQLNGSIPASFGLLSRLEKIEFYKNQLSGNIPSSIGQLSKLKTLDVSENSLVGVLSEIHFTKLVNLTILTLSFNSLAFNISSRWIPPFQLKRFYARSCNIGPDFPNWLQTQTNLEILHLSNSSIRDTLPEWFEKILSNIYYLDVSHNQIGGKLPRLHDLQRPQDRYLKMNSNNFEGSLTSFPSNMFLFDLSDNLLSGHVPEINETMNPRLELVNLSKNRLTGSIPIHLCKVLSISVLDLSENKFFGRIPRCLGNLTNLLSLHLHNNRFEGDIPLSLQNLTNLVTMNFGNNLLIGRIPFWIGEKMLNIRFLNLQSNNLTGKIPLQLCHLNALQFFNLAHNNITGTIPPCFGNLSGMITDQENYNYAGYFQEYILATLKGSQLLYTKTIQFLTSLDLSSNNIDGEIPDVLMNLVGLKNLNLSRNLLKGPIPMTVGDLKEIESLDLSMNKLSGRIPQSFSSLNFLSHLNLSFNNLSGPIPTGNQLQILHNPSAIFEGNSGLCGPPLSRSCKRNDTTFNDVDGGEDEGQDDTEGLWFLFGMGPGFVVGFVGILGSLHFVRSWRGAYFGILENVYEWVTVSTLLILARLRRKFF